MGSNADDDVKRLRATVADMEREIRENDGSGGVGLHQYVNFYEVGQFSVYDLSCIRMQTWVETLLFDNLKIHKHCLRYRPIFRATSHHPSP